MRCSQQVAPSILMCKPHWYSLPRDLRMRILRSYQPGQEKQGWNATTAEYQAAVKEAIAFIARREGHMKDPMEGVNIQ